MVMIFLGAYDFSSFGNKTPISVACTRAYFALKFYDFNVIYRSNFICSLLATITALVMMIVLLMLVVKVCKGEWVRVLGAVRVVLAICSSLTVVLAIPTAGHFLVFRRELDQCTSSY